MEVLKKIVSAWSFAFIVLTASTFDLVAERPVTWLCFLVLAITGSGWLWHRHEEKEGRSEPPEAKN
jgi:hypothetical protein